MPISPLSVSFLRAMPAAVLLLSLLLSEPPAFLLMAVGVVIFHELGHAVCLLICTGKLPVFCADGFGFRLFSKEPLSPHKEAFAALAGPLCNFICGILLFRMGGGWCLACGSIHMLYAFFNLLPITDLDGGRLLRFALSPFLPLGIRDGVCLFFSVSFLTLFYFFSLFAFYYAGIGLCGVFFAFFSFPWRKIFVFDDL